MKKTFLFLFTLVLTMSGCSPISSTSGSSPEIIEDKQYIADGQHVEDGQYIESGEHSEDSYAETGENKDRVLYMQNHYYNSLSYSDKQYIYWGGLGKLYKMDSETSEIQILYQTPYIIGATVYKDYIYSIEYNVDENGRKANLIRLKKDGSDKTVLMEADPGCFQVRSYDNTLSLAVQNNDLTNTFFLYSLDENGDILSDIPESSYDLYKVQIPGSPDKNIDFLIDPFYSSKYYNGLFLSCPENLNGLSSIWFQSSGEQSPQELTQCTGSALITDRYIIGQHDKAEPLYRIDLDGTQETVIYEPPENFHLTLLNYDENWIYFSLVQLLGDVQLSPVSVMRINPDSLESEQLFQMQEGVRLSSFDIQKDNCFYIANDATGGHWESRDLNNIGESIVY